MMLDGAREFQKTRFFPSHSNSCKYFKYRVFVGIGGNVGDTRKIFRDLVNSLKKDRRFFVREVSEILKNRAFGYEAQDDFLNAVILLETSLYAPQILKIMAHYEKIFKRERSFKNAPRTLDIDILYFSRRVRISEQLIIPHPGVERRISVVLPIGTMKEFR